MAADEERRRRESEVHLQMGMTGLLTTGLALCYCREPQMDRSTCHHLAPPSENGSPAFQPFSSQSVWQKTAGSQSPCCTAAHLCGAVHTHVITHTCAHTHTHTGTLVNIVLHTPVPVNSIRRGAGGLLTLAAVQIWSCWNVQKKICSIYF